MWLEGSEGSEGCEAKAVVLWLWVFLQAFSFIRASEFRVPVLFPKRANVLYILRALPGGGYYFYTEEDSAAQGGPNTCSGSYRKDCSQESNLGLSVSQVSTPANTPGHLC